MDNRTTYEPPRCPYCGANLFRVLEANYLTYEFQTTTGRYKEVDSEAEAKCPKCQANLYDVFPDGVCNFAIGN